MEFFVLFYRQHAIRIIPECRRIFPDRDIRLIFHPIHQFACNFKTPFPGIFLPRPEKLVGLFDELASQGLRSLEEENLDEVPA